VVRGASWRNLAQRALAPSRGLWQSKWPKPKLALPPGQGYFAKQQTTTGWLVIHTIPTRGLEILPFRGRRATMTKPQMLLVLLACLACQAYSAESEAVLDDNMNPVDIVDQISTQPGSPTSLSGGGGWIFGVALTTLGTVVAAVGNLMVTASHRMDKGSARARSLSISAPSKGWSFCIVFHLNSQTCCRGS
jgi:hypothetical protein